MSGFDHEGSVQAAPGTSTSDDLSLRRYQARIRRHQRYLHRHLGALPHEPQRLRDDFIHLICLKAPPHRTTHTTECVCGGQHRRPFGPDLGDHVRDLPFNRPDLDRRIHEPGRADDMLRDARTPELVVARG